MSRSAVVYCMFCRRVLPREEAHVVFRSGFYRTVYPLSCCRMCARELPEDLLPEHLRIKNEARNSQ